jgi:hypothetical protein
MEYPATSAATSSLMAFPTLAPSSIFAGIDYSFEIPEAPSLAMVQYANTLACESNWRLPWVTATTDD